MIRSSCSADSRKWGHFIGHLAGKANGAFKQAGGALVAGLLASSMVSDAVTAQERGRLIGSFRDWDALVRTSKQLGKECYMISIPKRKQASRRNAIRGDVYMTVTFRPRFKIKDEISVDVGYPLRSGSDVRADIDQRAKFRLFTADQSAWTYEGDETRMVAAMKQGSKLIVAGVSTRGTRTTDTYSLSGFTAAHKAISRECAK